MHLFKLFKVSRADIEGYTGEDELPPYCEMTLKATGVKEQRGDLHFGATLRETETSPIMIERTYASTTRPQPILTNLLPDTTKSTTTDSKIAIDEVL